MQAYQIGSPLKWSIRTRPSKARVYLHGRQKTTTDRQDAAMADAGRAIALGHIEAAGDNLSILDPHYGFDAPGDREFIRSAARKVGLAWGRKPPAEHLCRWIWRFVVSDYADTLRDAQRARS